MIKYHTILLRSKEFIELTDKVLGGI